MAAARRYRLRAAAPFALVIAVLCLPALCAGAPGDVEALAAACDARIVGIERRIQMIQLASSLLLLIGATLSAGGAGFAGFAHQPRKLRAGAALVAIFGALLCLSTTILPDRSSYRLTLSAADRQRAAGARARVAGPNDARSEYAAARFAECSSVAPSLDVPPPPAAAPSVAPSDALLIEPERVAPPAPAASTTPGAAARPAAPPERPAAPRRKRVDLGF